MIRLANSCLEKCKFNLLTQNLTALEWVLTQQNLIQIVFGVYYRQSEKLTVSTAHDCMGNRKNCEYAVSGFFPSQHLYLSIILCSFPLLINNTPSLLEFRRLLNEYVKIKILYLYELNKLGKNMDSKLGDFPTHGLIHL